MLNELAQRVHAANARWWIDLKTGAVIERNVGELLMLVTSELAEALEGHRKNLPDDKLPHRPMYEVELADAFIRLLDVAGGFGIDLDATKATMSNEPHWFVNFSSNFPESLMKVTYMLSMTYAWREDAEMFRRGIAWCLTAVQILANDLDADLMGAFEEKMAFNATRHDHSVDGRMAAGGKKY